MSPILASIYVYCIIDEWFEYIVKSYSEGEAIIWRYAGESVCEFQYASDVDRFYAVLPKRLEKYNLEVAVEKTNRLRFSRF